jgi:tryptophan synthase alpha chain
MYNRFKELSNTPLYVGFGIKDAEVAQKIAEFSDGIVIGSAIVETMGKMDAHNETEIAASVGNFVRSIRSAIDK